MELSIEFDTSAQEQTGLARAMGAACRRKAHQKKRQKLVRRNFRLFLASRTIYQRPSGKRCGRVLTNLALRSVLHFAPNQDLALADGD